MRLALFSARIDLEERLPRTKVKASKTFDFPDPFGPMMQLKSSPNTSSVFLAKDLNPCITNLFILVIPNNALKLILIYKTVAKSCIYKKFTYIFEVKLKKFFQRQIAFSYPNNCIFNMSASFRYFKAGFPAEHFKLFKA